MTHSTKAVNDDALALIADCEREIATLTDHIERMKRHHSPFDLSKYESQLKRQKVALAALTTEPADRIVDDGCSQRIGCVPVSDKLNCTWPLGTQFFTTPPAQLLHPVELPRGFSPAISEIFDSKAPVMRRDATDGNWLHKCVVTELLRSLGHEVKS